MKRLTRRCVLVTLLVNGGCTSPQAILQTDGPTMKELMRGGAAARLDTPTEATLSNSDSERLRQSLYRGEGRTRTLDSYTRTVKTEIDQLFPQHKNPSITMYVYPHMSTSSRAPIPGYTTVIKLYERDEYALPGERTSTLR